MPFMSSTVSAEAAVRTAESSYDPACFDALAQVEEKHFWFRARTQVISTLVRQITAGLAPGYRVLEVGCGTGNILRALKQACPAGSVTGMDLHAQGLAYARRRSPCGLLQGDIHAAPFGSAFDVIGAFDVLEHLLDDVPVLRDLAAMLKPGGALVVTVPAHPYLWSYFDEYSHHCRRYTRAELQQKLEAAGYHIEYLSEYMAAILPMVWLGRRMASGGTSAAPDSATRLAGRDLRVVPVVNGALAWLLSQEARWVGQRWRMPFGASMVALARTRPT
jgi:2-polyprenyl-3-methyl-5-hydroxy-6-metoxy-1,4-benzoquinol methylase